MGTVVIYLGLALLPTSSGTPNALRAQVIKFIKFIKSQVSGEGLPHLVTLDFSLYKLRAKHAGLGLAAG
ncbi:MAG: hypothetical protein A3C06_01395 [Candidatus Taylorbacteria bacterium RIFCSPHIGHO2_02_FULL_46_13]|uniref:Uncharacterized protein n=1 Tax=Candidatus Taylorbacteria bacterium RIFCSPHIGHO2_02_FULL_46_13 TaxID=1802312 RepID=A0A1G2MU57_9BACT|nr:MAG: hypothetical protein A3C06_01395 [Candidatus Taylorbacteria bacterium RIFCSPHIGHO2_02_FULL_46_13]